MLDTLAASAAEFLARLGKQQDAETARGRAADVRILAGNALYTELIDLCAIGKALYATTDARTHADYVVTDTPAPPAAPCRLRRSGRMGGNETGHPVGCPVLVCG